MDNMDNQVIVIRSPAEIAAEINGIRRRAARQLLEDSVEVGRLLVEAKGAVGHGEWGDWLEENFQYSSTEANNLMRLWEAYGTREQIGLFEEDRTAIFGRLNKSQAIALLGLPEPERAAFVEANPPEDLSVREWERRIEEAREEGRAAAWEDWREDYEAQGADLREAKARAEEAAKNAAELANARLEAEALRKEGEAAKLSAWAIDGQLKDAVVERDALRAENGRIRGELADLKENPIVSIREMTEEEKAALEDRIRLEIGSEAENLRADLSALTAENEKLRLAADPLMQSFQREFENFRGAYAEMKTLIGGAAEEKQVKLIAALTKVLAAMAEEWG